MKNTSSNLGMKEKRMRGTVEIGAVIGSGLGLLVLLRCLGKDGIFFDFDWVVLRVEREDGMGEK